MSHVTVLLDEAVAALSLSKNSVVVDATLGYSGHAVEICRLLGKDGTYIGIGADEAALVRARTVLAKVKPKVELVCSNFARIQEIVSSLQIDKVDAVLADLGWRMDQFTDSGKGFSFAKDEPLQMTYGDPTTYPFTVLEVINEWTEEQITTIVRGYGEERYARNIARGIIFARTKGPIETTAKLVEVISAAVPGHYRHGRIHPATRTFQALRMVVNDELTVLEDFLKDAVAILKPEGKLAVITFHSIEDRLVKHYFRELERVGVVTVQTKRPIIASPEELERNPRARSAKLRIISKNELL